MSTKKYSHNLKVESYFIWWECLGLRAQEMASHSVAQRKLLQGDRRGSQAIYKFGTPEQAVCISKIRYQVKTFHTLCIGRCKPLGSLNSFLSCAPQLSGANPVSLFTLLLAFTQLLSNLPGGWQHLLDLSFGSPHSH